MDESFFGGLLMRWNMGEEKVGKGEGFFYEEGSILLLRSEGV